MIITFFKEDAKGTFWYYSVHDRQGNLFTEFALTVVWGREPNAGREKVYLYESAREMDRALRLILRRKVSQGYKVLYRFARKERYVTLLKEIDTHAV